MMRTLTLPGMLRNSWLLIAACLTWISSAKADALPRKHAIVASHKLATDAGLEMLRKGGSAVDAAIAAQLVMGLVQPQYSGIGGGAFLVHYQAKKKKVETYDGRETAPKSVTPNLFMGADGKPMGYVDAVVGGRSVGVPGLIAALALAHKEHGRLKWVTLFEPAITLAEQGFPVSAKLAGLIARDTALPMIPDTAAYFIPDGKPLQEGAIVKNQAYADALRLIAKNGRDGFYKGPVADAIVAAVQKAPRNAVDLTLADLAGYKAIKRKPVCSFYRAYKICSMGPPSSGAVTSQQILKLMERFDVAKLGALSPQVIHLFSEAQRLAFADRGAYLGDPGFVAVPLPGMLDARYMNARSRLLSLDAIIDRAKIAPGKPKGADLTMRRLKVPYHARPSTSHISVVDAQGNALAMTTTVEGWFGSHLMASGFILNNQLTDFSFRPGVDNQRFANAPAAGKRPLSSMTPTLVFDAKGRLFAVLGSAGSWRIIPHVTETLIGLIDWKLDMGAAVALPHVTSREGPTELEAGRNLEATADVLKAMGHDVKLQEIGSDVNAIRVTKDGLDAAADPRREGSVGAD
jgi:gamma-glutamyltranspeptidase/glutathione hydrolase